MALPAKGVRNHIPTMPTANSTDAGASTPGPTPEQLNSMDYKDAVRKTQQTNRDRARVFIRKNPTTSV